MMKDEWKLFFGYVIFVILLLLLGCTNAPNGAINIPYTPLITYELIEPLGTKHKYRQKPLVDKPYYCLIHEYPEIIYVVDGTKRVRQWSGHGWR